MLNIKYFGIIAEVVNATEEEVLLGSEDLGIFVADLSKKYALEGYDFQVAVNRKIITDLSKFQIKDSDEIAFLPAFAGG